jgi:hypothetical protein
MKYTGQMRSVLFLSLNNGHCMLRTGHDQMLVYEVSLCILKYIILCVFFPQINGTSICGLFNNTINLINMMDK